MSGPLRWLTLTLLAGLLVVAWWSYGEMVGHIEIAWEHVEARPMEFAGRDVDLLFVEVLEVEPERNRLLLEDREREVETRGVVPGVEEGDVVSVEGRVEMLSPVPGFPGVPVLFVERAHRHRGRDLKWASGAAALLLVGFLCLRDLRRA